MSDECNKRNAANRMKKQSWNEVYKLLCEFLKEFERFPHGKEIYKGYGIGAWCVNQRLFLNQNKLSEDKINALNSIGFIWDKNKDNWNKKYDFLLEFKEKNGRFIELRDTYEDKELYAVYVWCSAQKREFKNGSLSEERTEKLKKIGFEFNYLSCDEKWEEHYRQMKEMYLKFNGFPSRADIGNKKLSEWLSEQRKLRKKDKLSEEKIKKLDEIEFVWDTDEEKWNKKLETMKKFVAEYKRPPAMSEKFNGCNIGQWYCRQLAYLKSGKLSKLRVSKLNSLGITLNLYIEEVWQRKFEALEKFIKEYGRLPYEGEYYESIDLYNWICSQKLRAKNNRLDDIYTEKFKSINIDLLNFGSCKSAEEVPAAWLRGYEKYKKFLEENGRRPDRSEGTPYRWRKHQIKALRDNSLNEKQKKLLEKINFG